jgi:aldose 1-epimerase
MQLYRTKPWGSVNGEPAELFKITDPDSGFTVEITDFGATLVRVVTPDRNGKLADINFGQDNPDLYPKVGGFFGAVTGRVANRISNARFQLDGKEYKLAVNQADLHCLHGGIKGFNVRWWKFASVEFKGNEAQLKFTYESPDGEENFPGTMNIELTYFISPMKLGWEFKAVTDKPTIVNLTNHAYWNLEGLDSLIDDHEIAFFSDYYMPGDNVNLVTGEVLKVEGTAIDLRKSRTFKEIFATFGDVDNNFFLSGYCAKKTADDLVPVAEVYNPKSGRWMKVATTEPCCQIYTGNYMAKLTTFGKPCQKHSGFCLETQRVPNAINLPGFRDSVILRPGQTYYHKTVHEFGTK